MCSDYEGLLAPEIRERRKSNGLDQDRAWSIWRDGCEGGECVMTFLSAFLYNHLTRRNVLMPIRSPEQVTNRIDSVISDIRAIQSSHMHDEMPKDIVLVAHGLFARCFAKRWLGYDLSSGPNHMMEPGGLAVFSYSHHNIEEPALYLGVSFPQS